MAIDSKHAFIAMEEVVSNNCVKLVVNGIVGRKAVVNAAIGNIHIFIATKQMLIRYYGGIR